MLPAPHSFRNGEGGNTLEQVGGCLGDVVVIRFGIVPSVKVRPISGRAGLACLAIPLPKLELAFLIKCSLTHGELFGASDVLIVGFHDDVQSEFNGF